MKIKQLHDYFLHILEKQLSIQCKNQLPVFILGSGDATLQFSFNFIRIHHTPKTTSKEYKEN